MYTILLRIVLNDNLYEAEKSMKLIPRVYDTVTYPHDRETVRLAVEDVVYEDDGGNLRVGLVPTKYTLEHFSESELVAYLHTQGYKIKVEQDSLSPNQPQGRA